MKKILFRIKWMGKSDSELPDYFSVENQRVNSKNPCMVYHHSAFDAASTAILGGIRTRQGIMLLMGQAGLGKTLVLQHCMAQADDIRFILLGDAHLDFAETLDYLRADLGLRDGEPDAASHNQSLLDALAAYASRGQAVALLIDDAHHLSISTLLGLWEFVETSAVAIDQRLQVVLAGLPAIEDKLSQPELRPLQERIGVRCRLDPLNRLEARLFVARQLEAAGYVGGDLLSPAAVERIAYHGQGVPRAIARLCDAVLSVARLQSEPTITPAMVDEVAGICFFEGRAESAEPANAEPSIAPVPISPPLTAEVARHRRSPGTWVNGLALAAIVAISLMWLWPAGQVAEDRLPPPASLGQQEQRADPPDAGAPVPIAAPIPAATPLAVPITLAPESEAPAPEGQPLLPTGTTVAPLAPGQASTANPQVLTKTKPKVTRSNADATRSQPSGASPSRSWTARRQARRIQSQPGVAQYRKDADFRKGTRARRKPANIVPYPWERPTTSGFNQK